MPFIVAALPLIAEIAGIAGAGTSIGFGVSNALNQPDTGKLLKQQEQKQADQAALQKREALLGQQGNAQAQTGGSLTDQGFQDFVSQLAGYPGFGSATPGQQIASQQTQQQPNQSPVDMASILRQLNPTGTQQNISGGSGPAVPPSPQQWFELATPPA